MENEKESNKLVEDNAAALAAGMSYGKWKAKQPPVETPKPPDMSLYKFCANCKKVFLPHDKRQKYCSVLCRKEATNKKRLAKDDYSSSYLYKRKTATKNKPRRKEKQK